MEQLAFPFSKKEVPGTPLRGHFGGLGEAGTSPILHSPNFKSLPVDRVEGSWGDWLMHMILDIPSAAYKLEKSSWPSRNEDERWSQGLPKH